MFTRGNTVESDARFLLNQCCSIIKNTHETSKSTGAVYVKSHITSMRAHTQHRFFAKVCLPTLQEGEKIELDNGHDKLQNLLFQDALYDDHEEKQIEPDNVRITLVKFGVGYVRNNYRSQLKFQLIHYSLSVFHFTIFMVMLG